MKFCRECASGNQGQNCPAACKGTQGSCACHADGCCKLVCQTCVGCSAGCTCNDGECFCANK